MDRQRLRRLLIGELSAKRAIRSALSILVMLYVGLFVYGWFFADRLIFQPHPPSYSDGPRFIKLSSGDGVKISAVYLPNPKARYTILYSHGNAEDLGDILPTLEDIRRGGFAVLAYDYRGYGTSAGRSSEQSAYQDEEAAYDYLMKGQGIPANRIIAHGRSLGGAMAIDLANRRPVAALIVQSSFVSSFRVLTHYMILPFDDFPSIDRIGQIHVPVFVIHGTTDRVIAPWHGQTLYRRANSPKRSYWVEGAGHDDLPDVAGARYLTALRDFAASIDSTRK
jgi:fermentation-respiration switch protein FrsA (DUF1100 family)